MSWEYQAHVSSITKDLKGNYLITFSTAYDVGDITEHQELLDITIKKHRDKRSLQANAYAWQLINKLSNKLRISKEECYLEMLKRYGQSEIISVLSDVDIKGFVKYYEPIGIGYVEDKEFIHYKVFKGSSEYDTQEMSILIDGIVDECKAQGIETMPQDEIERMLVLYEQKFNSN